MATQNVIRTNAYCSMLAMTRVCNMLESARGAFCSIIFLHRIAYVRVIRACLPDLNKKKAKLVC